MLKQRIPFLENDLKEVKEVCSLLMIYRLAY